MRLAGVAQAAQSDAAAASAAAAALATITAVNQYRWSGTASPPSSSPAASPSGRLTKAPRPQSPLPADLYSPTTMAALRVRPRRVALHDPCMHLDFL